MPGGNSVKYYHWLIMVVIIAITLSVIWPAIEKMRIGRVYYQNALTAHPRGRLVKGQYPFLYLTWFRSNTSIQTCSVCDNGLEVFSRTTYGRGTSGGGGTIDQEPEFKQLQSLPPLPAGLRGPDTVSHLRLLIVSHRENGRMVTYYYNRDHLPQQVQDLLVLLRISPDLSR
jgi:hypothetical protein